MPLKNTFCTHPFLSVTVGTNGGIGPCCNVKNLSNIKKENILEYWNGEKLKQFREKILSGQPVEECRQCYESELIFNESLRTYSLLDREFVTLSPDKKIQNYRMFQFIDFPLSVEFQCANLCNLKCLTCKPEDSSLLLVEDNILKISNFKSSDYIIDNAIIETNFNLVLENAIKLDLRGGESMLVPAIKKILASVNNEKCSDKILKIQTNGTVLDDEWKEIFKKFKLVEIVVSIDAINTDLEYIRFPAKWNVIEQNFNYFKSVKNIETNICCTLSNLNLLVLDKFLFWVKQNNCELYFSPVKFPEYYQVNNLPQEIIDIAYNKLKIWFDDYPNIKSLFDQIKSNTLKWPEFCKIINLRDNNRNNSIFNVLPELKEYWYEEKFSKMKEF